MRSQPSKAREINELIEGHRKLQEERLSVLLFLLGRRLNDLSFARIWPLLALGMISLGVTNYLIRPMGVYLSPLFVLPIYLVCWRFNFGIGLTVAVTAAMLSIAPEIHAFPSLAQETGGNLIVHIGTFTSMTAIVSSFRSSYERERIVARRDSITGALTRTAFQQQAESVTSVATTRGVPLMLAYLDLDGFKDVNDRYGHEAGDQVLERFGVEGRAALRREDCFRRMGGDEFALLMVLPSMEEASETAWKLHQRFTAALASSPHAVTCSMGALTVEPAVTEFHLDQLIRKADRLMYVAKHGGKNGVRFAMAVTLGRELLPLPEDSMASVTQTPIADIPEVATSL